LASLEAIDDAVQCASIAARQWGRSPLSRRAAVLFSFRELLQSRSAELAAIVTAEHGKVLSDAAGEVARGLENVEFATGVPQLMKGGFSEQVSSLASPPSISP
jgi:malonate-semialdehyde dehydrogenase (acetylating)/methylmalonate-semialdehyde dehydrogenase